MTYDLRDKVAIVTGAGRQSGIGHAIAIRLASEGARLVIVDIGRRFRDFPDYPVGTSRQLERRAREIRALGATTLPLLVDVRHAEDIEAMVTQAIEQLGQIDILVNNAAVGMIGRSLEFPEEAWDRVFDVNVKGTWLCSKAVARQMIAHRWAGKIVNVSSQGGRSADMFQPAYNSSKAAVIVFTQCLAKELAPHSINVNAVCPGLHDTELLRRALHIRYRALKPSVTFEEFRQSYVSNIPLGRMGTPEDVADLVAFLVSDESRYITGQAINVNGGYIMS